MVDVLGAGAQAQPDVKLRDGIARPQGKSGMPIGADAEHRASTIEGQIARVADIIAYVNHDIDDAVRAGILDPETLPRARVEVLGHTQSERSGPMGTDVVLQSIESGMAEIRMGDEILQATVGLRSFLFEAVYENEIATAEFKKAAGILGGLWERVKGPRTFLDQQIVGAEDSMPPPAASSCDHSVAVNSSTAVHPKAVGFAAGSRGFKGFRGCTSWTS